MHDKLVLIWRVIASLPTVSEWVSDEDHDLIHTLCQAHGEQLFTGILPKMGKAAERWHEETAINEGLTAFENQLLLYFSCYSRLVYSGLGDNVVPPVIPCGFLKGAIYTIACCRALRNGASSEELAPYWPDTVEVPLIEGQCDWDYERVDLLSARATRAIRALTLFAYKLEVEPTLEQMDSTWDQFVKTDLEIGRISYYDTFEKKGFVDRARRHIRKIVGKLNPSAIRGFHGSGSSACGVPPQQRYGSERVVHELNALFPYDLHFCVNENHLVDIATYTAPFTGGLPGFGYVTYLEDRNGEIKDVSQLMGDFGVSTSYRRVHTTEFVSLTELNSKVAFVPKDSRAPRLISEEPRELMFIQQGLRTDLEGRIDRSPWAEDLKLTDQVRQKHLARESSRTGRLGTLDMKEASDRVSLALVKELFPPDWFAAFSACRSPRTVWDRVSDDGHLTTHVCEFAKFAPMGSALCFPVEQLVFWGLCRAIVDSPAVHVSVFGDDIIVDASHCPAVVRGLEMFGLKTNVDKSFWRGFLRESCGGYYLRGHDISVCNLKGLPVDDYDGYESVIAFLNNLFGKFYHASGYYEGCYYPMFRNTSDGHTYIGTWEDVTAKLLIELFSVDHVPYLPVSLYDPIKEEHSVRCGSPFVMIGNPMVQSVEGLGLPNDPSIARTVLCTSMRRGGNSPSIKTYVRVPLRNCIPEDGWSLLFRWFANTEIIRSEFATVLEENLYRERQDRYQPGLPLREYDPCGYEVSPPIGFATNKRGENTRPRQTWITHTVTSRQFKYAIRSVRL